MLTSIGVHVLDGQPPNSILLREAGRVGLCSIAAGFLDDRACCRSSKKRSAC